MTSMKTTIKFFALISAFIIGISLAGHAQVVIKVRPVVPGTRARPMPPSHRHILIDGEWVWGGARYVWVDGYWVEPRPDQRWRAGHWKHKRGGWIWVPGHWQRF